MSVELIVEVLLHAPPSLTPAEKLLLTVIAESCNKDTRLTWYRDGWDAAEVARRAHLTVGSLSKTFWSLAQKGCEVRVAHGTDKHGKPIFAHKGKQTTFKLPRFAPQRSDEDRTLASDATPKGPTYVGVRSDADRGLGAQRSDEDRTLLLKDLPSKNPSSLSARETTTTAPAVPAQQTEREIEEASQKSDKPEDPITAQLIGAGCPEDLTEEVRNHFADKGAGWFAVLAKKGHLPFHVMDALESLERAQSANVNPDHLADAHAFEPKPEQSGDCQHCPFPAANGRHKVGYQGGGYVSSKSGTDRQGRRRIRSPADQRVADGQDLYDYYKQQEASPGAVNTGGYFRMTDSHHPDRDYGGPL